MPDSSPQDRAEHPGPGDTPASDSCAAPPPGWTVEQALSRLVSGPEWKQQDGHLVLAWLEEDEGDGVRVMSWVARTERERGEAQRFYAAA